MKLEKVEMMNVKLDLPEEFLSSVHFLHYLPQMTFPENLLVMNIEDGIPTKFLVACPDESLPILKFDSMISDPRLLYAFRLSHAHKFFSVENLKKFLEVSEELSLSWSAYFAKARCKSLFPRHSDDHDVFVFQLFGERVWQVEDKIFHLIKGSLLKIPRGVQHEVLETKADSLHMTVGNHSYIP